MLPTVSTRDGRANASRSELPVGVMEEPVLCSEKPHHRKTTLGQPGSAGYTHMHMFNRKW